MREVVLAARPTLIVEREEQVAVPPIAIAWRQPQHRGVVVGRWLLGWGICLRRGLRGGRGGKQGQKTTG